MTDRPKFVDQLLNALNNADEEARGKAKALNLINEAFDTALADALGRWLESQQVPIRTVTATLAYMLGSEYYHNSSKEEDVCFFADAYASYAHQVAHALWHQNGPPKSKKSS